MGSVVSMSGGLSAASGVSGPESASGVGTVGTGTSELERAGTSESAATSQSQSDMRAILEQQQALVSTV